MEVVDIAVAVAVAAVVVAMLAILVVANPALAVVTFGEE